VPLLAIVVASAPTKIPVAIVLLALAGCATNKPIIETQIVEKRYPVYCKVETPIGKLLQADQRETDRQRSKRTSASRSPNLTVPRAAVPGSCSAGPSRPSAVHGKTSRRSLGKSRLAMYPACKLMGFPRDTFIVIIGPGIRRYL
jgi:hypothetical protein